MAVEIPYRRQLEFEYGKAEVLSPGIRRVIANNPGPFTFHGTGTYILGTGQVAVIDPGPDDQAHIDAILASLDGETVSHILVTHTHMDHSPGCRKLQAATGAPTFGYGPHGAGKQEQGITVEEGGDMEFAPDQVIRHGDIIEGGNWSVECVYTPGHTSNHMCFALREEKALFTGDHVMGWSTSIISPPDGDMADYMKSLQLLLERDDVVYWPTHGPCIDEPKAHVQAFIQHREGARSADSRVHRAGRAQHPRYGAHDVPRYSGVHVSGGSRGVLAAMENLLKKQQVTIASGTGLEGDYRRVAD